MSARRAAGRFGRFARHNALHHDDQILMRLTLRPLVAPERPARQAPLAPAVEDPSVAGSACSGPQNGTVAASSSSEALLTGEVTVNDACCWSVRDESGDVLTVERRRAQTTLKVPGVDTLQEDTPVMGSGGEVAADMFANVADACGAADRVLQLWAARER